MIIKKKELLYNLLSSILFLFGSYVLYLNYGVKAALGVALEVLAVYIGVRGGVAISKSEKKGKDH